MTYTELQVTTNYSFLRGASHVEELCLEAKAQGYTAIGVTDRNSLAGMVRAHQRAEEVGLRLVVGCRLDLSDCSSVLVYPTDRPAYSRLCRLLTHGKRNGKYGFDLTWQELVERGDGLLVVLVAEGTKPDLSRLRRDFGDRAYVAITVQREPGDAVRRLALEAAAYEAGVPTVATGDVLYHVPQRRILQDVVTCIREGCTIDEAGARRERNADRHLKSPEAMAHLLRDHREAIARTQEIVRRCRFSLTELRYQYPDEVEDHSLTAQQTLEKLTWEKASLHYPDGVPEKVSNQLRHELALIAQLEYAPYFLTVHNIVRFAMSKDILCQGRGSAANSAVCFVLGITAVDPTRTELLFERFISAERQEPPDIDVDFEHERREEVIKWVYDHYGRDRAALCATVMRFRSRGAVRDVGKVLGLTEDVTSALAGQVWGWREENVDSVHAAELGLNLDDRRLLLTIELARELIGFPRQLGTHPGGFVLTRDRLDDLVPIEPAAMEGRQVIEWDKDDIEVLKFMKVDVLGLGMLGCLRRAFELMKTHYNTPLTIATIPPEDVETYCMIQQADTLGTFQIESRAQMSMLPRLKPKTFYDLVIQIAIVRPGPIQGDMVHPYLRRRDGIEKPSSESEALERVLKNTLGVPLFQEQAMRVAMVCAGFTASEADQLRRSMATFKKTGGVSHFKEKLINGMMANEYSREFAEKIVKQIEGFGSYGFPESHAASFALIAYASAYIKCHHPDVFCAALLNSQPMGFYAPAQIVRDAGNHGVEVRPVCINNSRWDCTLENADGRLLAVRLGLRMAKGVANTDAADIVGARGDQPYTDVESLWRRTGVSVATLERLAEADAFRCFGLDRRQALWATSGLSDGTLPLFAASPKGTQDIVEPSVDLPSLSDGAEVVEDYRSVGLSLRRHPVAFLRAELCRRGIADCASLNTVRDGQRITIAGLVLVRQRPGSASGVIFVTIEDESSFANVIVWPKLYEAQRRTVLTTSLLACHGRVQREGLVIHVIAERLEDLTPLLRGIARTPGSIPNPPGPGRQTPEIRVPTRDFR
jgi:error-prone DNA polymerase